MSQPRSISSPRRARHGHLHLPICKNVSFYVRIGTVSAPQLVKTAQQVKNAQKQPSCETETSNVSSFGRGRKRALNERQGVGQSEVCMGENADERRSGGSDSQDWCARRCHIVID